MDLTEIKHPKNMSLKLRFSLYFMAHYSPSISNLRALR